MTQVYDYTPSIAGRPVDVAAAGGAVTRLQLFPSAARAGVATVDVTSATNLGNGTWRFTFDDPPQASRYYPTVTWTASSSASPTDDRSGHVDLPRRYDLLVSIEDVLVKLGIALPGTDAQRERVEQEIVERQTDAANYINRSIIPFYDTVTGLAPRAGFSLLDWRSWPQLLDRYDDQVAVTAVRTNPDGGYDVDVAVGLVDPADAATVARFVRASAVEGIRNDPAAGMGKRQVTSVSAEGQSVEFDKQSTDDGAAGALPKLASLSSLKRKSVFRARGGAGYDPPFPYSYHSRRYY